MLSHWEWRGSPTEALAQGEGHSSVPSSGSAVEVTSAHLITQQATLTTCLTVAQKDQIIKWQFTQGGVSLADGT